MHHTIENNLFYSMDIVFGDHFHLVIPAHSQLKDLVLVPNR